MLCIVEFDLCRNLILLVKEFESGVVKFLWSSTERQKGIDVKSSTYAINASIFLDIAS